MDAYKKVASLALIEMMGVDWIDKNKSDLCTYTSDDGADVTITFCLISSLPTEEMLLRENDINYQPEDSISFVVNKKDKTCRVHRNLLP